jgi:hypothetical protein
VASKPCDTPIHRSWAFLDDLVGVMSPSLAMVRPSFAPARSIGPVQRLDLDHYRGSTQIR